MDPKDQIIQDHAPLLVVPRFGLLPRLTHSGHRYLATQDGLMLEVVRPWLRARALIAPAEIPLPYGTLPEERHYAFTARQLLDLRDVFAHEARRALPNEAAAWVVFNAERRSLDYVPLVPDEASPGGITFTRPRLQDHEHVAIDFHSHGSGPAFFSAQDDADDAGEIKFAVVVGTLDGEPTFASRLCLMGVFL